ncbi:AdeC/AdeK/OprM family multidrug efflux complex outer membrane factor [soil metagenome]
MRTMNFKLAAAAAAVMTISGCINLAPDYQRPAAPVQSSWPTGPSSAPADAGTTSASLGAADIGWRDFFGDERLRKLIDIALTNNRDLRIATINIEAARAQYGIQRSALFPTIAASASESAQRSPGTSTRSGGVSRLYDVSLGVSQYELDFWGRVRNLKDSALQQFLATDEARRATQISLIAEVASTYLQLAADRERLQLAQDTFKSQRASYELTQRRFDLGAISGLDLRQAQITVETARADAAAYTSIVAQDENALAVLTGAPVPSDLLPSNSVDSVSAMRDLPAQLPSEVLQRRPDVLQAEHLLLSANANIGAARAAFFPSITLTGAYGTSSTRLGGLFDAGSKSWSFLPNISLPIFDGGLNRSNLDYANANRDLYVAQYEKAIQVAFREVADALAQRGTIDEQLSANEALARATAQYFDLSDQRFRRGADDYLAVLDAQRTNYNAQQNLITVRLAKQTNLVTLYRVLGGGWTDTSAASPRSLVAPS